jgi:hypothetical protein
MKNEENKTVFSRWWCRFLKSLEIEFLQHTDFIVETYATGELCLANLAEKKRCDYSRLPFRWNR